MHYETIIISHLAILSIPQLGCYFDITKFSILNMNQYLTENDGQRLSLENQVQSNPVKKVSKTLMQVDHSTNSYSWNEIRGLSWIFSEDGEEEYLK